MRSPPPNTAELSATVLPVSVTTPWLYMPPPWEAVLLPRVQFARTAVPALKKPPPNTAELPDRVTSVSVTVPALYRPPPVLPQVPLARVRPLTDAVTLPLT